MRKLSLLAGFFALCLLNSCEKNNCQTSLFGKWHITQQQPFAGGLIVDSVNFYKGDSVYEQYKLNSTDTTWQYRYCSLYIGDDCNALTFTRPMILGADSAIQFDILFIDSRRLDIRSKAHAGCDSCIISMSK